MSTPTARLYAIDVETLRLAFAGRRPTMFELVRHLEETGHELDSNDQVDYLDMVAMDDLFAAMGTPGLSYSALMRRGLPGVELERVGDGLLAVGHVPLADSQSLLASASAAVVPAHATDLQRAAIENLVDAVRTAAQLHTDLVLVCP